MTQHFPLSRELHKPDWNMRSTLPSLDDFYDFLARANNPSDHCALFMSARQIFLFKDGQMDFFFKDSLVQAYFLFTDTALLVKSRSDPDICFAAGFLMVTGIGGPKNLDIGVQLLKKYVELGGSPLAAHTLAAVFLDPGGGSLNPSLALDVLDVVAQDGDLKAKHFFALSVFEGDLFGLDASSMTFKAEEYLIDAADEGFPPSVAYVEERRHHREIQMVGLSSFSLNSSSSSSSVGFSSNLSLLSQSPDLYCNYLHEEVELEIIQKSVSNLLGRFKNDLAQLTDFDHFHDAVVAEASAVCNGSTTGSLMGVEAKKLSLKQP